MNWSTKPLHKSGSRSASLATALFLLVLPLLFACGTPAPPKPGTERSIAEQDPTGDTEVAVAVSAYLFDGDLYLRTRAAEGDVYGLARGSASSAGAQPIVVVEDIAAEQWLRNESRGRSVPVFDSFRWYELVKVLKVLVTPSEPGYGAVIDVVGEQDLFSYYDELGTLRTVPIVYKPESVRVQSIHRLDHAIRGILPAIGKALAEGEPLKHALLGTGDEAEGGYPFVFLDFERGHALFLRSLPERWSPRQPSMLNTTTRAAFHVTTSHVRAVVEQPVTSLVRLFTLVTRTTGNLIDPRGIFPPEAGPLPPLNQGPGMDLAEWESALDRITGEKTSLGRIAYLVDGEQFFPRLIDTVASARNSVLMRIYIFDNDDIAFGFADLLKRRSNQDVRVKVMVDGLGTIGGGAAQPTHTPAVDFGGGSIVRFLRQESRVKVRVLSNPWLAGDHTKVIIVDDRIAFAGGMNIGREYRHEWHDMMVELSGPVVDYLRDNFEKIWTKHQLLGDFRVLFKRTEPVNPVSPKDYPVRILRTDAQDAQILKAQIAAIRNATQRIYIQNAYFTSDAILYELARARRRGVDVRVILPYQNDSGLINRSNAIASNRMLANGIRVYIYPGMSHLKGAVYDGWACLGSANFDALSLQVNKELNIATSHPPAVEELVQRVFLPDMEKSVELTEPFPPKWHDFLIEMVTDRL
jgi:cardiolipin synthase